MQNGSLWKKAPWQSCAPTTEWWREGVTQTGQEVTRIVAENFTKGQTSVTCMCRVSGTDVFPVDVGMAGEGRLWDGFGGEAPAPFVLLNRRAGAGSRNLVREAAMTVGPV